MTLNRGPQAAQTQNKSHTNDHPDAGENCNQTGVESVLTTVAIGRSRSQSPPFAAQLSDERAHLDLGAQQALLSLSADEDLEFRRLAESDESSSESAEQTVQLSQSSQLDQLTKCPMSNELQIVQTAPSEPKIDQQNDTQTGVDSSELHSTDQAHEGLAKQAHPLADNSSSSVGCARPAEQTIELRFLVRRREAGALIGKRGTNIKRLRESFRSSMFSIPDTGNGPERVVCIVTNEQSLDTILADLTHLLLEKSPENDEQIELKLLIHSSHAGSIIGIGGQSIKKLRNDSKAAIKIYEMCCPLSSERVCAIKAKPPVVVSTIKLVHSIVSENPLKGTVKPYDALHFDLNLVDKYGGYLPDEPIEMLAAHGHYDSLAFIRQPADGGFSAKHYQQAVWRAADGRDGCDSRDPHEQRRGAPDGAAAVCHLNHQLHPQLKPSQSDPSNSQRTKNNSSEGVQTKRDSTGGESEDRAHLGHHQHQHQLQHQQQMSAYSARPARFHPYAPLISPQVEFSAYNRASLRHQLPSGYPRMHFEASLASAQNRGQYVRLPGIYPNLPDRCRNHMTPCLCMYLPSMVSDLDPPAPFMQLAKNFAHPRNSTYGYKKK